VLLERIRRLVTTEHVTRLLAGDGVGQRGYRVGDVSPGPVFLAAIAKIVKVDRNGAVGTGDLIPADGVAEIAAGERNKAGA
jgi:hypothetical protein